MTYQRDSKVQVYRCKKHQFNSLMLFKIHVRLELSWIIKEKRKKKKEKRNPRPRWLFFWRTEQWTQNTWDFVYGLLCLFIYFLESFNLWRPLLMIILYHQTKTPISFWCRWRLNSRSLIHPLETLPVELTGIHGVLCFVGQYLVCRNKYTCTIEFYFLIRNTRPGQMAYCKCGPR